MNFISLDTYFLKLCFYRKVKIVKFFLVIIITLSFALTAQAAKNCDELVGEIKAKLDAKGVQNYELQIVDKNQQTDLKIVGTCGGGTKKITYIRK